MIIRILSETKKKKGFQQSFSRKENMVMDGGGGGENNIIGILKMTSRELKRNCNLECAPRR